LGSVAYLAAKIEPAEAREENSQQQQQTKKICTDIEGRID
jgi:hypothetical protein